MLKVIWSGEMEEDDDDGIERYFLSSLCGVLCIPIYLWAFLARDFPSIFFAIALTIIGVFLYRKPSNAENSNIKSWAAGVCTALSMPAFIWSLLALSGWFLVLALGLLGTAIFLSQSGKPKED